MYRRRDGVQREFVSGSPLRGRRGLLLPARADLVGVGAGGSVGDNAHRLSCVAALLAGRYDRRAAAIDRCAEIRHKRLWRVALDRTWLFFLVPAKRTDQAGAGPVYRGLVGAQRQASRNISVWAGPVRDPGRRYSGAGAAGKRPGNRHYHRGISDGHVFHGWSQYRAVFTGDGVRKFNFCIGSVQRVQVLSPVGLSGSFQECVGLQFATVSGVARVRVRRMVWPGIGSQPRKDGLSPLPIQRFNLPDYRRGTGVRNVRHYRDPVPVPGLSRVPAGAPLA